MYMKTRVVQYCTTYNQNKVCKNQGKLKTVRQEMEYLAIETLAVSKLNSNKTGHFQLDNDRSDKIQRNSMVLIMSTGNSKPLCIKRAALYTV